MYLEPDSRGRGEPPRKQFSRHSKGYPEVRDPAAENPQGVMRSDLTPHQVERLRHRYGPPHTGLDSPLPES